jgi:hypothetical protein
MFTEMYGIGCAFCGQATRAWVDDYVWPCRCPAATAGPEARPPERTARRLAARRRGAARVRARRNPGRPAGPAVPA